MKDLISKIFIIIFTACFLSFGVWWTCYKYQDCKQVGHSKLYCVMKVFSN